MRSTKQQKTQLQIALLGMDERSCKIMSMFFKGPCEGHAVVVDERNANIAIIDTRFEQSKQLLEQSLAQGRMRAIIVLSSQSVDRIAHEKIMYLDKPITADPMFEALDWAKDISEGKKRDKPSTSLRVTPVRPVVQPAMEAKITQEDSPTVKEVSAIDNVEQDAIDESAEHYDDNAVDSSESTVEKETVQKPDEAIDNKSKIANQTAMSMQVEESDFSEFIGTVVDIDLDDATKQRFATYDPDKYYQGYVQRAFNRAVQEKNVLQLTLGWNPLIIVPQSNQIWWDADDKLLKAVSDIEINSKTLSVVPLKPHEIDESVVLLKKKQAMDVFLWKLTLWSSRGRYPCSIDIDSPIQLKRWPNFTRYIVTPHALRISALLIKEGPDTMIGVANALNIELRYVSVFISAVSALNLIRQIPKPKIDEVMPPVARNQATKQKRNIFNKIINKLLGR